MNSKSSILVVDDEENGFDVIEALLFKEGYNLTYAASGNQALNHLTQTQPDAILLDVMMPDINGIELCRQIKANSNWHHIPIIMVTALASKEDLARCLDAGADDFISKPLTGIELRSRVRSMLRIKKQHDALAATLELREDMSNMIIHDLRNPLTNIMFSAGMLLRVHLEEKERKKVNMIWLSAQKLHSLTNDLLLMAKMESGKMILNQVESDLGDIAKQVVADLSDLAKQKNIRLIGNLPEEHKNIFLDANLFVRIIDNLISNAIKFSPSDSQIAVSVEYFHDSEIQARIRVIDEGQGIRPEVREYIFAKYEVGNIISGVSQTGLGLAFCKMAVEAHGGRIFVEDNQPTGSVFTVEILNPQ